MLLLKAEEAALEWNKAEARADWVKAESVFLSLCSSYDEALQIVREESTKLGKKERAAIGASRSKASAGMEALQMLSVGVLELSVAVPSRKSKGE